MKIRTWALTNTVISIITCASLGATIFLGSEKIKESRATLGSISRVAVQIYNLRSLADDYLIEPRADIEKQWLEKSANLLRQIRSYRTTEARQARLVNGLEADYASVQAVVPRLLAERFSMSGNTVNQTIGIARKNEITRLIESRYKTLLNGTVALRDFESLEILAEEKRVAALFVVNATFLLLLVIGNFFLLKKRVVEAVDLLQTGTVNIGEGNFDQPVDLHVDDEMGDLSRAIDRMAQRLKETTTSRDELERGIADLQRAELSVRKGENALRDTSRLLKAVMDGQYLIVYPYTRCQRSLYVR